MDIIKRGLLQVTHEHFREPFFDLYSLLSSMTQFVQCQSNQGLQTHSYLDKEWFTFVRENVCEFLVIEPSMEELIDHDSDAPAIRLRWLRLTHQHFRGLIKPYLILWFLCFYQSQPHIVHIFGIEVGDVYLLRTEVLQHILFQQLKWKLDQLDCDKVFDLFWRILFDKGSK